MSAGAGRRGRGCVDCRPFFGRIGMQRKRMKFAHQATQGGVDLLVALDAIKPLELLG